jgi:hypothetical protein
MKPEMFQDSVLTANDISAAVYHELEKYKKDLMKWRWNLAEKAPTQGEFATKLIVCIVHSDLNFAFCHSF